MSLNTHSNRKLPSFFQGGDAAKSEVFLRLGWLDCGHTPELVHEQVQHGKQMGSFCD